MGGSAVLGRVTGARDADFPKKRLALVDRLRARLAVRGEDHPSFRNLAEAAGVSQATLRHYFGNIAVLISAVLESNATEGAPYLAHLSLPAGTFEESIADAVEFLARGQREQSVRAIHCIGTAEGIRRGAVGDTYRTAVLDPVIRAIQCRLDAHVLCGDMRPCDTQVAAIALYAPVLLFFQHQSDLAGHSSDPIDLGRFLAEHTRGFVRGYCR